MKKIVSALLILVLLFVVTSGVVAEANEDVIEIIISDEIESWEKQLQKDQGDWARVYYDKEQNVLYSYADLYLARMGVAGQAYDNDPAIWMIEKFRLSSRIYYLSFKLNHSKSYKNTKVVVAYVTGGEMERFEDYHIAEVGNFSDAQEGRPTVFYSISMEDCTTIDIGKMKVHDYFFGETSVVTFREAAPYLN